MDILVFMNMFHGLKTLQEMCRDDIDDVTLQIYEGVIRAFDALSAVMPADKVTISIEVQQLVKKIVAAEERYLSNEIHQPAAAENNWELRQDSMSYEDYQVSRAALIQRLETDLNWTIDRHHRRQQIIETVEQIWPRHFLFNTN